MKRKSLHIFGKWMAVIAIVMSYTSVAYAQTDIQVGTGTNTNSTTTYPTPFGDWYEGTRAQFLFTAQELTAAGMGPGLIMGVRWDVKSTSAGPHENWELSIGSTTNGTLNSFVTGLTSVWGPTNYTPTQGVNSFIFPTPVTWNGTDNIVVQTCHGDASNTSGTSQFTTNAVVEATSVSGRCINTYRDNSGNLCATTSVTTHSTRPNIVFIWAAPCTGIPSGFTVDGPYQVCPNRPFKLGLQGPTLSNLTHQWQYSKNGQTWSNFIGQGATTETLTDSITSATWYRCVITCTNSNQTFTTQAWKVGIAPFYYCYCLNKMSSTAGIDIGNVTIVSNQSGDTLIDNGNPSPATNNKDAINAYTEYNYTVSPPCVYRDSSYSVRVKEINAKSSFEGAHLTVFIDYNRDGEYDTSASAGEKVISKKLDGTNNPAQLVFDDITIPSNAQIGLTGMRVILSKDTVAFPCGDLNGDGEVEDYIVKICYRPCDGPTNAGLALSSDTSMCTSYEYTLTNTTYEQRRSGFETTWQISADNINWFHINNSGNKDTLNRVFTGQPLYYRMRVVCPITDDTTFSQETFVNAKPGYKCYCYSKAIGGALDDTSDIGGITVGTYSQTDGGSHVKNPLAYRSRTDHTDETPNEFYTDSVYSFYVFHTLKTEEHGDSKITVFVDFNNNNKYDIPEEHIYTGFTSVGNHTLVDNINIPYNVITDVPTGMRFILNNNVGPNVPSDEACGPYTSGETEDFIVIFRRKFPASVGKVGKLDGFGVYPNPTTGKFYVQFNTPSKLDEVKVNITNVTGQQVFQQVYKHNGGSFNQELNLGSQPSGVYFVELHADGENLLRKLIIK